jgi:uncharacterized protein
MCYFYAETASIAIDAMKTKQCTVVLSCDLNLTEIRLHIDGEVLLLDDGATVSLQQLETIKKQKKRIYVHDGCQLRLLEIRNTAYVKLVPTDTAPFLETSGVKLHISKGICPFVSASHMAEMVVKKGDLVLDTCSGLGYSAIRSVELGSKQTVTVEINADIMRLRTKNPWSQGLYQHDAIIQKHMDSGDFIKTCEDGSFNSVIHDPPRFSLAGELYGYDFYKQLKRVLKKRGQLFHYTGNPHTEKNGNRFVSGVTKRLYDAGFKKVVPKKALMGVQAFV